MKTLAGCMMVVGLLSVNVSGGTVTFSPDNVSIVPFGFGEPIEFDLWITDLDGTLGAEGDVGESFDGIDLLIGASDGLEITGFVFNSQTVDPVTLCNFIPSNCSAGPGPGMTYASDFKIGMFAQATPAVLGDDGFLLGTLTVEMTGLPFLGEYYLFIDGDFDGLQSSAALGSPLEAMYGSASIKIPEPAALTLLGLASVALVRRRAAP